MTLAPQLVLAAYAVGTFPMADASGTIGWYFPEARGVLELQEFHLPKRFERFMKRAPFRLSVNEAFERVLAECAAENETRPETWINEEIRDVYTQLHRLGFAHSVECWHSDREMGDRLVGGLYGVSLGSMFFGESMFSRQSGASKAAFAHLVARMKAKGYTLLDTQYVTKHLEQFGVKEMAAEEYVRRLFSARNQPERDLA